MDKPEIKAEDNLVSFGAEVKDLGDGKIGGYLVLFGDPSKPDLEGDFFTKETNFGTHKTTAVYYQHTFDGALKSRVLDSEALLKFDDVGVWVEAQLALRDDYERAIYEMAKSKKLGWSSGTAGHLVERENIGKAWFIKSWPLGLDASITPTPAEPRTHVVPLKTLVENGKVKGEELPEAGEAVKVEPETAPIIENKTITQKENKMEINDELKAIIADTVKSAVAEAVKKDEPAVEGAVLSAPAVKKVTDLGFKDDENKSFFHWIKTGDDKAYKAAMQGQTDSEGGYAVPDGFGSEVAAKRNELSIIRQMGVVSIQTDLDRVLVPAEDTAATKFVVTAEEGAYDENEPTLAQVAINIYKMTKLIKLSEELEGDAKANFGSYLSGVWGRALAAAENYYFVATGSGTSMPLSLLQGATTSGITTAGATAITAAEILQLIYKLGQAYSDNMALVMARATLGSIRALSGNPFSFIANPSGEGTGMQPGFIHGIPVYVTDAMPAMTAGLKSAMVVNPDFYMIAEREGMTVSRNQYLYEANGQIGLFAKYRAGGSVTQAEAHYYLTQHA